MMFTEKRHSYNPPPPPTPKRTYDVSRGKNRYVRLPLQTSVKQDDTTRTRTPKPGYLNLSNYFSYYGEDFICFSCQFHGHLIKACFPLANYFFARSDLFPLSASIFQSLADAISDTDKGKRSLRARKFASGKPD